jgi:hypothetical protein
MRYLKLGLYAAAIALAATGAKADAFINGSFETGDASGWTEGAGYRGNVLNNALSTDDVLPGGSLYNSTIHHSAIVNVGDSDPNLGALVGDIVYSGNHSYRVEDTTFGGYASAISQEVKNYTDPNIFFAWKAVLQNGGHSEIESAELLIELTDETASELLISRIYNAGNGGGGVDQRFSSQGSYFYTPDWQIEQLAIDASRSGHDFLLTVLGADCQPTGHTGYVYLDGFGNVVPPPTDAPEPLTLALFGAGLAGLTGMRLRKKK